MLSRKSCVPHGNCMPRLFFPRANVYKGAMKRWISEIATAVGARVVGHDQVEVSRVSSIAAASAGDLVFVEDEQNLTAALQSQASALIAGPFAESSLGESSFLKNKPTSKALLIAAHPRLAFARAAELLREPREHESGIHPGAEVHQSAKLGDQVAIGAHAYLHEDVRIGDRTWIGTGCVIGKGVSVGKDCEIYPNVTIYPGARIGNRVIVHAGAVLGSDGFGYVRDPAVPCGSDTLVRQAGRYEKFPQIGRLEIEDDVEIGANTTIDRGALEVTRIGRGAKIDNLVHIGHNCQIGENVIIAAQAGLSGSIVIEDNVIIGGQVGVGEHARIQEGVMLGGQSGVLPKKILRGKGIAFWGTPAKPLREYLKSLAALARLGRKE
jgi:UDP-3-O-[3-hydroxymyristoyl] glucosamine N-acyltransferase